MSTDAIGGAVEEAPTTELVSGAVGGNCANCHAPLASDQRYCLNCGVRRGKPRFPVVPISATETRAVAVGPPPPLRPRVHGAATLVAGIATLLIAMGVGFLIGHDSNAPAQRASAPFQVVTVGGGSASTNPAQATQPSTTSSKHLKPPKTIVVHLTPKLQQKAAAAASKVFGTSGNLSKNVTQKVGGSCSGGAGCQNGKFTGNFFSGG